SAPWTPPACPENPACDFASDDEDIMKAHMQTHKSHPFVCEYGCTQRDGNSDESVQRTFKDAHEVYMHISKYHSELLARPFHAKQPKDAEF
ncbi:hypothetical protein CYLTODRAFT_424378, partial [Cylindrobasidium torrendii FP15055 ss-10]